MHKSAATLSGFALAILGFLFCQSADASSTAHNKAVMPQEFSNPPQEYGVRCWWWWLNSNVTKEAITRDLEAMKAKGFSGALIFDAGGAEQRGNRQVPAGPRYASEAWRQLLTHAVREAERLGLELGLSIQSGWNLGGPSITPQLAAKRLTFSEIEVSGPAVFADKLPQPPTIDNFYRDIAVLAWPVKPASAAQLTASFQQTDYPAANAADGNPATYWVSGTDQPQLGPAVNRPQHLLISLEKSARIRGLQITPHKGYGPRKCQLQVSRDGQSFESICSFEMKDDIYQETFESAAVRHIRLVITGAFDPRYPETPRNVQIAEIALLDEQGRNLLRPSARKPIQNLELKAMYEELGMSAPDCRFLLDDEPPQEGEEDVHTEEILNLTDKLDAEGRLHWQIPQGRWTILRCGFTPTEARVSTSSQGWEGRVLDYMNADTFRVYWNEVVEPLLADIGPSVGRTLKYLQTDSWECGGMNWTDSFAAEFQKRRGYDPIVYLPVIAGKIVDSRIASNAFLADFRKTIGDCVADNHYQVFADLAHQHSLGIQPESGGPHAGPFDAIKCLGRSDMMMSEFWVPSPHRPRPVDRFYVKQAASAAHIYGRPLVGAESFTSIGPHWNDVLWKSQKPSMDHEFCSGLNLIFLHTFTCSPPAMGLPGQEYFAGTHINPQVTWWDYSDAFFEYIARCQYLLQKGLFEADVLYYYGDHIPNVARLKEDDPAKVLPGFDYDLTNEEILLQLNVEDGRITVPGGLRYRLLVLPDHKVLSLAALEKIDQLVRQGATVLGPKPQRLVSLTGGQAAQEKFKLLAEQLWPVHPSEKGQQQVGSGRVIWGKTARQVLIDDGILPDFEYQAAADAALDYIHYTIDGMDIYFVCNQTEQMQTAVCRFRITDRQAELWNPLTGQIRRNILQRQTGSQTEIPLRFEPYGSLFVLFQDKTMPEAGVQTANYFDCQSVLTIAGPWRVHFDPIWGGPSETVFERLISWTEHPDENIRFYSGKAIYETDFVFEHQPDNQATTYWLDLGRVEDIGIARIRLNGQDLGIVWTPPFRAEISTIIKAGKNRLEVDVINSWRNRLIGDRDLPADQRRTKTNIRVTPQWTLLESGLLGPVQILAAKK